MINLSEIDWGPTDAARPDPQFTAKFVEPIQIRQLLLQKYCVVTGEKGSGKTALRQALLQKYGVGYSGIVDLDFDRLEYTSILFNLNQLAQITNISRLTILTNYWQYVLIIQAVKNYVERHTGSQSFGFACLNDYLTKNGLIEGSHLRIFLSLISKCWTFIDSFTHPSAYSGTKDLPFLPTNFAPEVIEQIRDYPMFNPEFVQMCKIFEQLVREDAEKILVILDGFDRFENKTGVKSDVNLVFESLVDAVYSLSISKQFCDLIYTKALVPHDRYLSIYLRDCDKFDEIQKSIKWTHGGLQEFLGKRAQLHPKLKQMPSFEKLWREIMPETLVNPFYKVEERSYDYILRHTMYRPRQLQIHLKELAEMFPEQKIEPDMIPKAIRRSCRKIVEYYIREYYIDHPLLDQFIARCHNKLNVMAFQEFRDLVADSLKHFQVVGWSPEGKIDILYEMGLFGVIQPLADHDANGDDYLPPRKVGVKPYRVLFYYKNPRSKIINKLKDSDLIAFHPVFFDYADMNPHPEYIIG